MSSCLLCVDVACYWCLCCWCGVLVNEEPNAALACSPLWCCIWTQTALCLIYISVTWGIYCVALDWSWPAAGAWCQVMGNEPYCDNLCASRMGDAGNNETVFGGAFCWATLVKHWRHWVVLPTGKAMTLSAWHCFHPSSTSYLVLRYNKSKLHGRLRGVVNCQEATWAGCMS